MQMNPKRTMLAVCLGATMAFTGLTGCQTHGDRTAGRYIDDRMVARRVNGALSHDPVYKYPDVNVVTYDGIVQLSGFVDTADQKNKASAIAQSTEGVRQVVNSLVLKPHMPQAGAAGVINNDNRVTPTGSPTGRRLDATTTPPPNWNNANTNNYSNPNVPANQR
ncbi:MAG: transporter [Pedosphaera sp.]|nr:transporter [Pedosphaera sp.]